MQYPMIDRALLADLKLVHGAYNIILMVLFLYQGCMGFGIRRSRKSHEPLPFSVIKRHRRTGPVLVVMGFAGYAAGLALVMVDTGNFFEYPAHLTAGTLIMTLLPAAFLVSRKIKGQDSPYRDYHLYLGISILCMYLVNIFLGIGALL